MGSPSPSIVRAWGRKATWRQEARLLASTKAAAQRLATAHGGELLLVYRPRAHPNLPSLEPDQVCRFLWQLKVVFYSLVFVVPVPTSTSVGTFYMKNLILFPTIALFYLVSIPCFFFLSRRGYSSQRRPGSGRNPTPMSNPYCPGFFSPKAASPRRTSSRTACLAFRPASRPPSATVSAWT